jgi:hypothetical protein
MTCRSLEKVSARLLCAVLLVLIPAPLKLHAQKGIEGGIHGLATFADFTFAGAGLHAGLRPGGRVRFSLGVTGGSLDEGFGVRAEASGQFLLNPSSRKRGLYAGGGIAGVTGRIDQGYLLLLIGIETRPGGDSGWALETGIGGGIRVMAGYRWRKLRR